jgi:hypothetical protein
MVGGEAATVFRGGPRLTRLLAQVKPLQRRIRNGVSCPLPTYVRPVTPNEPQTSSEFEHAREEIREGLRSSREIIRKCRMLIELSASDGARPANDNQSRLLD